MKKLISLLLSIITIISLVACNTNTNNDNFNKKDNKQNFEIYFNSEKNRIEWTKIPNIEYYTLEIAKGSYNIKNNFYFELTVTKTNGDKQSYQIKLDATEVTPNVSS